MRAVSLERVGEGTLSSTVSGLERVPPFTDEKTGPERRREVPQITHRPSYSVPGGVLDLEEVVSLVSFSRHLVASVVCGGTVV